jgi:hypothetical protein
MSKMELKILIIKSGKKAYEIARELNWHPSKISTILSGFYVPSSTEKEDLAHALDCRVCDAFPSDRKEKQNEL